MELYPVTPNRIKNVTPEFKTNIVEFENGTEQRNPKWHKAKRTFLLEHNMLNADKELLIQNFFDARQGSYEPFTLYNHVDGRYYTVRFKADTLQWERINKWFANLSVEVVTC